MMASRLYVSIFGNHGFFYNRQASHGIKNMRVQMPKDLRSEKLVQTADEDDRTNCADVRKPYTMQSFIEAYRSKKAQVFYTNRLNDVAEELDNEPVTYYTKWKDLGPLDRPRRAALSKAWSKKKSTRIRQVPAIAPILARACEIFTERTQQRLDYQAETSWALMLRALECILITKRLDAPQEKKEALWITPGGMCAECGDSLGESFETA